VPKIASLTDVGIRNLSAPKCGQIDYWDTSFKQGSFACRASQGGAKSFIVKHRNRRITIGTYPTISLSEARTEAKRILAELILGKSRPPAITYLQAVELFLADKAKSRRASTVASYKRLLALFSYGGRLAELTHPELERRIKRFTAPSEYNHVLVVLRLFCNWAIKRQYIEHNPTIGLSQHARRRRTRVLTDAELKLIWRACEVKDLSYQWDRSNLQPLPSRYAHIVRLLVLTGQRRGEIAALRPCYYSHNEQTICLPQHITKNGREHTFPVGKLLDSSLQPLIAAVSSRADLLFPSRGKQTPFNGWGKAKETLDDMSGVREWTLHDIRRTFRTNLGRLGVAPHIAERLVNHISSRGDMEEVYDRWTYMPEMRQAIEKWEAHLTAILSDDGDARRNAAA
jgi:integrase